MPELSLIEIIKYSLNSLFNSEVFILVILELAILIIALVFKKLMDKKIVGMTSIIASLIVLSFYISNYVNTLLTFLNNVSTKLVELIYFPTTLEFMLVMIISFGIMIGTYFKKEVKNYIKVINTVLPLTISFLFLSIIEYINVNSVPFDEFSVFTNPVLMSLYELAMGLFISWLIGLIVIKIDKYIIESLTATVTNEEPEEVLDLVTVNLPVEDEIELPKLKNGVLK
ncbi:MAG: hypothetical protein J1F35_04750 [Erysipelotrichales bacterium]|nr:hypothetical protein [Erysipelotrichales bacterium]